MEYPSVEETEAAFNIMNKKKEVKLLVRTDELVAALRAKKKMRLVVTDLNDQRLSSCI